MTNLLILGIVFISTTGRPIQGKEKRWMHMFPLEHYSQNIHHFLNERDPDYNRSLISNEVINKKVAEYKERLIGKLSPWSKDYISSVLKATPIRENLVRTIQRFSKNCNTNITGLLAENFKPYPCAYFDQIKVNLNLDQCVNTSIYQASNRAIATDNINARVLPTQAPIFATHRKAGSRYPFDLLQESAIWAGAPLYILWTSKDQLWSYVVTANKINHCWVPTQRIARVSDSCIQQYTEHVQRNGLKTVLETGISIYAARILFPAYIGSVFPAGSTKGTILVPIVQQDGYATLIEASTNAPETSFGTFPIAPTPKNFAMIIKRLIGRPYGWGGLYFYNDCSQELQSLFTVFGIWLPRNAEDQGKAGVLLDLSNCDTKTRIQELAEQGRKLCTLIYIPGHIMLYVGNDANHQPWIYHEIWGLRPANNGLKSIIGQAALMPLIESYPEDPSLLSLADDARKTFSLVYLDR